MLKKNWEPEELIESWTLIPQELKLVRKKVGGNQIGFALLLKYFQLFARFPDSSAEIPDLIISYIANQLDRNTLLVNRDTMTQPKTYPLMES